MIESLSSTAAHQFDASILRQYDIRGVIDSTLTETDCYYAGRAFGTLVARRGGAHVVVGYDGRKTSVRFAQAVRTGLADCGLDVTDIGLAPTPMVYFALQDGEYDAGVVVTGSHSPLNYNGIKMAYRDGPFYGDNVQDLGRVAREADYVTAAQGTLDEADVQDRYVERLLQDYSNGRDLTVVWDNGNGAAGEILRRLTRRLPGKHILLYDDIDGTYPNHHPDPTVAKNLVDLQHAVRDHNADVGIGFDGDADRIGMVDEKGDIHWADVLIALYAQDVLRHYPGAPVIADVKSSRVLYDEIARLGGTPVMWNTGHSLIKAKMKDMQAPLAGELAGHICFADKYYGFDDAPYAAVRLLDILARTDLPLSALLSHLPEMHSTPELRFSVAAEQKFKVADDIKARLTKEDAPDIDINDIDGIRVTTPLGWWLLRGSNTEDVLTVRVEAFTTEGLETLKTQVTDQLAACGIASPF